MNMGGTSQGFLQMEQSDCFAHTSCTFYNVYFPVHQLERLFRISLDTLSCANLPFAAMQFAVRLYRYNTPVGIVVFI